MGLRIGLREAAARTYRDPASHLVFEVFRNEVVQRVGSPGCEARGNCLRSRSASSCSSRRLLLAAFIVDSNGDTGTGVGNAGDLRYVITQLDLSADPSNTIDFQIAPLGTLATIMLARVPAGDQPTGVDRHDRAGLDREHRGHGDQREHPGPARLERLCGPGIRHELDRELSARAVDLQRRRFGDRPRTT